MNKKNHELKERREREKKTLEIETFVQCNMRVCMCVMMIMMIWCNSLRAAVFHFLSLSHFVATAAVVVHSEIDSLYVDIVNKK